LVPGREYSRKGENISRKKKIVIYREQEAKFLDEKQKTDTMSVEGERNLALRGKRGSRGP